MIQQLLGYLLKPENREKVRPYLKELKIDPPLDTLVLSILDIEGYLQIQDLLQLSDGLNGGIGTGRILREIPSEVSDAIGQLAVQHYLSLGQLEKVNTIIRSNSTPTEKLEKIYKISAPKLVIGEPHVKLSSELTASAEAGIFEFLYPMDKGEAWMLAGYTGLGKTRLVFALLRLAIETFNLKPLYIGVEDWSEPALKRLLNNADFPDVYVSVYPECGIEEITQDIEQVKPDIVFVDSMTVLRTPPFPVDRRYEQLAWISSSIKRLAQTSNTLILSTHQTGYVSEFVTITDLQDSKSHILRPLDGALGFGGKQWEQTRNISTLKLRKHEKKPDMEIALDFENLILEETRYYE